MQRREEPERRYPRIGLRMPVTVCSIDPDTDVQGRRCFLASEEICANVSLGGAGLLTQDPLAPGRRVLLGFELPDGGSFETVGRVAWSRSVVMPEGHLGSGCGVEFLEGGQELSERLLAILRGRSHPPAAGSARR